MPSEKLYREFQMLERKIMLLINENTRLHDQLSHRESENQVLKEKLESQKVRLNSFQDQEKINSITNNMVVSREDSAPLKNQIDNYIKEIDKCISHLAE